MANEKKKKQRRTAPKDETTEQRTRRLTEFRVSRALKDIGSIRNLSGGSYTLSYDQKAEVIAALKAAVKSTENAFAGRVEAAVGFQLIK